MRTAITPGHPAALVWDGARVMVGGFFGVGTPHRLVDALVADPDRSEALPEHSIAERARQSRRPAQEQPTRSNEKPSDGRRSVPVSAAS